MQEGPEMPWATLDCSSQLSYQTQPEGGGAGGRVSIPKCRVSKGRWTQKLHSSLPSSGNAVTHWPSRHAEGRVKRGRKGSQLKADPSASLRAANEVSWKAAAFSS